MDKMIPKSEADRIVAEFKATVLSKLLAGGAEIAACVPAEHQATIIAAWDKHVRTTFETLEN